MGTPPNQMLVGVAVRILVDAETRFDAEIRKTPMAIVSETSLPRALGESELMSASFNGSSQRGEGLGSTSQVHVTY